MKFIFMLLILFLLADPVMAGPVNNTSQCLNMYHNYIEKYGTSQLIPDAQMRNFIGRCLPDDSSKHSMDNPIYIDGTQHRKLLRNFNNDKTVTVKA
jgi:hypothetical protein